MKILSIETSCDETAISILEADGGLKSPTFSVLGDSLFSQANLHKEFGGVYPNLAKREHAKNLTPLLKKTLEESKVEWINKDENRKEKNESEEILQKNLSEIQEILKKEDGLFEDLKKFLYLNILENKKPNIDLLVVTEGPGLAPALWVGISFAKALSEIWDIPLLGANHMEGHMASILFKENKNDVIESSELKVKSNEVHFPALALLISGGHTELVSIKQWGDYKLLGQTVDDAVGEAFDKVARMLELPYPGGPEISKLAQDAREKNLPKTLTLPRPMIHSKDLRFSFSGLKTAVLYTLQKIKDINDDIKKEVSREFEDAVTEVLVNKTRKALGETNAKTLIIGGGVISNNYIRKSFEEMIEKDFPHISLCISPKKLATDNAVMIGMAGYLEFLLHPNLVNKEIIAKGNLKLD